MRGRVATHEVMIFIYQFHRENQWGETFFEECTIVHSKYRKAGCNLSVSSNPFFLRNKIFLRTQKQTEVWIMSVQCKVYVADLKCQFCKRCCSHLCFSPCLHYQLSQFRLEVFFENTKCELKSVRSNLTLTVRTPKF